MQSSPPPFLARPRIVTALTAAVAAFPLASVSAPMGYGKTTAARELAASTGKRAFFITIPPGPNNARYLWNIMHRQMAEQGMEIARALEKSGFPEDAVQKRRAIDFIRTHSQPSLFILDDYHNVEDASMNAFIDMVVRERMPQINIVVLSRVKPNLPLEELRLKSLAVMFGRDLLAFTKAEAVEYFRNHDCAETAEEAWKWSEGWAAALWLWLQNRLGNGPAQPNRDIEALLAEAVFSSYREEERTLLRNVSLLDRFTPEEAVRLSGDVHAPGILRRLHDKNALLTHDAATNAYRLHGIFHSFLAKALAESGVETGDLHRRTAECHADRGDYMQAIRFFHRAGQDEDRIRIIELLAHRGTDHLHFFFPKEIEDIVKAIPWHLRERRPVEFLTFIYNMVRGAPNPFMLDEAEERFAASKHIAKAVKKRLKGEAALIRGLMELNDIRTMREHHKKAHRLLNGRSVVASRHAIWTLGCPHLAYIFINQSGMYREFVDLMEDNCYCDLADGCSSGKYPLAQAEWLLERGELDGVAARLADAQVQAEAKDQTTTLLNVAFTRARLDMALGRPALAVARLDEWATRLQAMGHVDLANCLDLAIGYVHASFGRYESIPGWIRDDAVTTRWNANLIAGFILAVHGKAVMFANDNDRLEAVARIIPSCQGRFNNLFGHIHAKALECVAAWRKQEQDKAVELLRAAIELARPDGIVATLSEYGAHLLPPVRRLRKESGDDAFVALIAEKTEQYARAISRNNGKAGKSGRFGLTPREDEIVRLVANGKPNAKIARQLGIAEDTVKKILTKAFGKLEVKNRTEAARKYREVNSENMHVHPRLVCGCSPKVNTEVIP